LRVILRRTRELLVREHLRRLFFTDIQPSSPL
jgi:hypothetical protein